MIYIDRDKNQFDMRGNGMDIITDIAFAVLMNAEAYAATNHKPLDKSVDLVIDVVQKALHDGMKDFADELRKNAQ